MHLEIDGERSISEIQKDFNTLYPYLKIKFFRKGRTHLNPYAAGNLASPSLLLKEAWLLKKDKGEMDITDDMSVDDFENTLLKEFGLSAQVFRRSGHLWLETTMTGSWTLAQQNEHGREITIKFTEG